MLVGIGFIYTHLLQFNVFASQGILLASFTGHYGDGIVFKVDLVLITLSDLVCS
jgi:hypothetical protein